MRKRKLFDVWRTPFYDEKADYNTNSKSYYDYLARFQRLLKVIVQAINRLLKRNIRVKDTNSIDLTKKGDWIDNLQGCKTYDDIIELSADIIISKHVDTLHLVTRIPALNIPNGSKILNDGLWSPDYMEAIISLDQSVFALEDEVFRIKDRLNKLETQVADLYNITQNHENRLNEHDNRLTAMEEVCVYLYEQQLRTNNAISKIVQNLFLSGAVNSTDLGSFQFNPNNTIASGNINIFSGATDGARYIRTSKNPQTNDITAAI